MPSKFKIQSLAKNVYGHMLNIILISLIQTYDLRAYEKTLIKFINHRY